MKRRLTSVLGELEWENYPATTKEDRSICKYCLQPIRTIAGPINFEKHIAPCGWPCLAGGVEVGVVFHDDKCRRCKRLLNPGEDETTYFIKPTKTR